MPRSPGLIVECRDVNKFKRPVFLIHTSVALVGLRVEWGYYTLIRSLGDG